MSETLIRTRADYPTDPILRDELAFQLRIGRHQPSVLNAVRDLGKTMRQAELEALRHAEFRDWAPGELQEAFGR